MLISDEVIFFVCPMHTSNDLSLWPPTMTAGGHCWCVCVCLYMYVCMHGMYAMLYDVHARVCVCVHNLGSVGCLESVEWNTGMEYWGGINL